MKSKISTLRGFFIVFSFIFCFLTSWGKEKIVFEQLTKLGQSSGTVSSILLDSKGFMWFCIDDELNRYDGYSFKRFKAGDLEKNKEQYIQFIEIVEDKYGTIWAATSSGLYFWDRKKEVLLNFLSFTGITLPNNILKEIINTVLVDSRGNLWVGTFYGLVRIHLTENVSDINNDNITIYRDNLDTKNKIHNNVIVATTEDQNHKIWIAYNTDILECYDYELDKILSYNINIPQINNWKNLAKKIAADHDNNLWISTQGLGVIFWNRTEDSFKHYQVFNISNTEINISLVRSIMIDSQNRTWIGTDGKGLIIFDRKNNLALNYHKDLNDQSKISSNAIYSMYEDHKGNFWLGTYLTGVNKMLSTRLNFGTQYGMPNSIDKLSHNVVTNFCEDKDGKIWISTDGGGVNVYDRKTGIFKHFKNDPSKKNSLSINAAIALYCDNSNRIWIGTYNGGLNIYDQQQQKFKHFRFDASDNSSISSNHVWGFAQDKWENMWIATVNSGLNLMKKGSDKFIRYQITDLNYRGSDQISCNAITFLFIDNKNRLWIASEWGLDMVELNKVDFEQTEPKLVFNHFINSDYDSTVFENRMSYVNQDKMGNIWVGTRGAGLIKLDMDNLKPNYYTANEGLSHNIVRGILFDDNNNVWVSTNYGLSKLDVKTGQFKNYDSSYGLQSDFFMKTSCLKTIDGTMFFGGTNGFNEFKPNEIISEISLFKPVITDFKIFSQSANVGTSYDGKVALEKSILETKTIKLSYKSNNISFEFSALDYVNPEKNLYLYKLDGLDKEWQMTDSKMRVAKYTNLSPGEYTFMVKASNNESYWSDNQTAIKVIISPPWWETKIFIIAVVVLFCAILIFVYYIRVYSLQKQKALLLKAVDEKTNQLQVMNKELLEAIHTKDKFMSIIAHDLINPFNSILGFSDLLISNYDKIGEKEKLGHLKRINQSSNDLYELLGNLLQWSRSERGLMVFSPEKIEVKSMINKILSIMRLQAGTKQIKLKTDFPDEPIYVNGDVRFLNVILRNLVSNSIKFSHEGSEVLIKIVKKERYAEVSVDDSGVGISAENIKKIFKKETHITTQGTKEEKGTGLGLLLVKEFVKKQNGKIFVNSVQGKGSTFTFTVPLWAND